MLSLDEESKQIIINVINYLETIPVVGSQNTYGQFMSVNTLKALLQKAEQVNIDNTKEKENNKM